MELLLERHNAMENVTIAKLCATTAVINDDLVAFLSGNVQEFGEEWVFG